jgi:hypothetical protein
VDLMSTPFAEIRGSEAHSRLFALKKVEHGAPDGAEKGKKWKVGVLRVGLVLGPWSLVCRAV